MKLTYLLTSIKQSFFQKSELSKNYIINSTNIFIVKTITVLINFWTVPFIIQILGKEEFGVWVVISTFLTWFNLMDLGIGNGLRNYLARALIRKDVELQKRLVKSTLLLFLLISVVVCLLLVFITKYLYLSKIFGLNLSNEFKLKSLFYCLIPLFCVQFFLQITNSVHNAFQDSRKVHLFNLVGSILGILLVVVFGFFKKHSLESVSILLLGGNVVSLIVSFCSLFAKKKILFFGGRFDLKLSHLLLISGFKLLILNIAYVVQFQTINVILFRMMGPTAVSDYNIAFKYYNILGIIFSILIAPLWGASSVSNVQGDKYWIISALKKIVFIWMIFAILGFLFFEFSGGAYKLWVGDNFVINNDLNLLAVTVIFIMSFTSIFIQILNGLNITTTQFYFSFFTIIFFFPVIWIVFNYTTFNPNLMIGILLFFNLGGIIYAPFQVYKYLKF